MKSLTTEDTEGTEKGWPEMETFSVFSVVVI